MNTISETLTTVHRHCDDIFAELEEAIVSKDWQLAVNKLMLFENLLEGHLQTEENIVFPRFENATGMTQGPTTVMRMEHTTMRNIFPKLRNAVLKKSIDDFSGYAENMHILLQQHNMKEEQMLYPMIDQHLAHEADQIITEIS